MTIVRGCSGVQPEVHRPSITVLRHLGCGCEFISLQSPPCRGNRRVLLHAIFNRERFPPAMVDRSCPGSPCSGCTASAGFSRQILRAFVAGAGCGHFACGARRGGRRDRERQDRNSLTSARNSFLNFTRSNEFGPWPHKGLQGDGYFAEVGADDIHTSAGYALLKFDVEQIGEILRDKSFG